MIEADRNHTSEPVFKEFALDRVFFFKIVAVGGEQDGEVLLAHGFAEGLIHLVKDGVVNGGHDKADGPGANATHGPGRAVADVSQPTHSSVELLARRRLDEIGMIEAARDRGD